MKNRKKTEPNRGNTSVDALKFESPIKQIIMDWIGLDPFGLNLIRGLDWIQIHALFKYNMKMD